METKKTIHGIIIILAFILISCATTKHSAVSCTEFPVYKSHRNYSIASHQKAFGFSQSFNVLKKNQYKSTAIATKHSPQDQTRLTRAEKLTKIEYSKGLIASTENTIVPIDGNSWANNLLGKGEVKTNEDKAGKCDTLILKSNSLIPCKIIEIDLNEIKYKKCNYLDGPTVSIAKSEVVAINYANGTNEIILSSNPNVFTPEPTNDNMPKPTQGLAIVGFLASLAGLFVASIPLGLIAIIFGASALGKISRSQGRYKGRGLAVAALIIGFIEVVGMLAILASTTPK